MLMPGQLVCRPGQERPVAVLTVTGVLDLITGEALEHAVARCLSGQPEAVLIDVSEMKVADPLGLGVLCSLIGRNAEWPDVPIVLCGMADPSVVAEYPGVTASASCAEALERTAAEPAGLRLRVRLRPVPDACRQARQLVTQACTTWQRTDLAATATLVATELVANVVRHAHTTMELTLGRRDDHISLAVRDGCRSLPRPAQPDGARSGGRGLHLVRELTRSWGVLPVVDGKVIWTRI
jgi:anti-sigma regulatory factor (Ser/Thr protein kinase)